MADLDSHMLPIRVETSVLMTIAIIAVLLRFWSRAVVTRTHHSLRPRFWWDDWFALATLPFLITYHAIALYWTQVGLGQHAIDLGPEQLGENFFLLIICTTFYNVSISLPKLSTVFFYERVFTTSDSRNMKRVLWLVGVLIVVWCLAATLTNLMQCIPIEKAWEPAIPGTCFHSITWWLPFGIASSLIDLVLLIIPLPSLWKLQLPLRQKALLLFVFMCGCSVIIISVGTIFARLEAAPTLLEDLTYNFMTVAYWSATEDAVSLVSVCLPAIFTLVKRGVEHGPKALLVPATSIDTSLSTRKSTSSKSSPMKSPTVIMHNAFSGDSIENLRQSYYAEAAACRVPSMEFDEIAVGGVQMESIQVKKEIDIAFE